jgi:hypothetical protein
MHDKEAEGFFKPKINNFNLPSGYKGPIKGYYDKVNRFFAKKEFIHQLGKLKPKGVPKINETQVLHVEGVVEDRLLRKGEEYKTKRNMQLTQQITKEIEEGPKFQPTLIADNSAYLPDKPLDRFTRV